jgi:hypothetical protein
MLDIASSTPSSRGSRWKNRGQDVGGRVGEAATQMTSMVDTVVPNFGLSQLWIMDGLAGCTFCVDRSHDHIQHPSWGQQIGAGKEGAQVGWRAA